MNKKLILAVDFDGTLCEYDFPKIGIQNEQQKDLMGVLIAMKKEGHKIILWTNRGDNKDYPVLTEAINWCKSKGLEFDAINENIPGQKKLSGYSPKIMADFYIDDKSMEFYDAFSREKTLSKIKKIRGL